MKIIPLTQGYETIVDDEDYEELSKHDWDVIGLREGYPRAVRKGSYILMTREIIDAPAHLLVDHKSRNTLYNRKSNLRICTRAQNQQNKRKQKGKTASKYKGVSFDRRGKKWRANIRFQDIFGQMIYISLGTFSIEEDAAEAYDNAARHYFGEFAALNFPEKGEVGCL